MTPESLFHAALAKTDPAERAVFLDGACLGQPQLRQQIEALLAAHDGSNPLDRPPDFKNEATTANDLTHSYSSTDPTPGVVIAGRYTLEQKLGEGGMGEVWVAKQSEPVKRKVAIKLIKLGMDSRSVVQRFEQERQALAMMDHPNIAKVLDGGVTEDRRPYFVMELVNGLPLTKFCDEAKLGIKERLELFVPICQAVQHAHQKGIVHRDLKPGNILVTLVDGKAIPKVIDFGVAKATGGKLTDESLSTQFGAVIGTLEYMAPEQAGFSNVDVDTRADIYSLGIVLYELLTGLRPFDSKRLKNAALDEMIRMIREDEPSKPSTRLSTNESLPSLAAVRHIEPGKLTALLRGELDWVVMKCLEKQRDRRYETANGLARDIQRYLANETVEARPPSAGYRFSKFLKRNKGSVLAAGLLLGTLILGIIGTTIGLFEAKHQEQVANEARQAEAKRAEGERLAKLDAEAQKEQAQTRLRQIEKGNAVLTSIFDDLNITKVREGIDPLEAVLAKRLTKAAKQLEGEAIGDPLVVAHLQNNLGTTLMSLGYPQEAIILFQKARETWTSKLGADHPETLTSMNNLAEGYRATWNLQQALPLLEQTVKLRKAKLGADDPATLNSMDSLAGGYQAVGKLDQALPLYEKSLELVKVRQGTDHHDTLTSMANLAVCYHDAGKLDQALPLYVETLKLMKVKLGADHHDTLASMNNLASGYRDVGNHDLALPLMKETLKLVKLKLGADHPHTLTTMGNLAKGYLAAGKLDLAIPLYLETLELAKVKLGSDHPCTFTSMDGLAEGYTAAGKHDLAISLYEETLKLKKIKLGIDHFYTIATMNNLAQSYYSAGKLNLAIPLHLETLELAKVKLGVDHSFTLTSMNNLARSYWKAMRLDMSIPLFEQTLKLREAKLGRKHPHTLQTMANLGVNNKDAGRISEALPLLEEAYRESKPHALLYFVGPQLLDGYAQAGKTKETITLASELLADARAKFPKDSPQLAGKLVLIISSLLDIKAHAEVEPLLREYLTIRQKLKPDEWSYFNVQSMLGGVLLSQKKYADAEPLLLSGYEGMKQRGKTMPPPALVNLPHALDRLIQLYTETNKPDEAKKWQAEKEKLPKPVTPATPR